MAITMPRARPPSGSAPKAAKRQDAATDRTLAIGALSRASGCNIETIRYYERVGVLPRPQRTANGRRVYRPDDANRLAFVRRARDLGFSLDEVRTLLTLADRTQSCGAVRQLAVDHLAEIRRKIADLQRMEGILAKTVRRCRGPTAPHCPILEALSVA